MVDIDEVLQLWEEHKIKLNKHDEEIDQLRKETHRLRVRLSYFKEKHDLTEPKPKPKPKIIETINFRRFLRSDVARGLTHENLKYFLEGIDHPKVPCQKPRSGKKNEGEKYVLEGVEDRLKSFWQEVNIINAGKMNWVISHPIFTKIGKKVLYIDKEERNLFLEKRLCESHLKDELDKFLEGNHND